MGLVESEDIILNRETIQDALSRISVREENDIIYNNNRIRTYLCDKDFAAELNIRMQSISMAIKKCRLELLLNILSSFSDIYKFAALDIKYFDEHNSSLKVEIIKSFAKKGDVRLLSKNLSGMLEMFDEISKLSPTNAAIALNSSIIFGEITKIEEILLNENIEHAFVEQIKKRYFDNFLKKLSEDIKNMSILDSRKRRILGVLEDF